MEWTGYLTTLEEAGALQELLADQADPLLRQEACRLFFLSLAAGYLTAFADPDLPDWVPAVNTVLNASSANPDFIYYQASVDGARAYRITGQRGDALFVSLDNRGRRTGGDGRTRAVAWHDRFRHADVRR